MEMQFLTPGTHNIDRQEIAYALAMIIEADVTWRPYGVYPDRDHHWVLDRSNKRKQWQHWKKRKTKDNTKEQKQ